MVIHVYAICWNDAKMLPHFFNHYDDIADHYYIYDNGSTDPSLSILESRPNVTVRSFEVTGDSLVKAAQQQYNQCWKQSRGVADWVIVCDVDEHLYHPNLKGYLQDCTAKGITIVQPEGYDMVSDDFPGYDMPLYRSVTYGVRNYMYMDKPEIFNPNAIEEIHFGPGRHYVMPAGRVVFPPVKEVLLLHYKYIGFDYVNQRMADEGTRLPASDIVEGLGTHWLWTEGQKREIFDKLKREGIKVLNFD